MITLVTEPIPPGLPVVQPPTGSAWQIVGPSRLMAGQSGGYHVGSVAAGGSEVSIGAAKWDTTDTGLAAIDASGNVVVKAALREATSIKVLAWLPGTSQAQRLEKSVDLQPTVGAKYYKIEVVSSAPVGFSFSPEPLAVDGELLFREGTVVELLATPTGGYTVKDWGDPNLTDNPLRFTVTENRRIVPNVIPVAALTSPRRLVVEKPAGLGRIVITAPRFSYAMERSETRFVSEDLSYLDSVLLNVESDPSEEFLGWIDSNQGAEMRITMVDHVSLVARIRSRLSQAPAVSRQRHAEMITYQELLNDAWMSSQDSYDSNIIDNGETFFAIFHHGRPGRPDGFQDAYLKIPSYQLDKFPSVLQSAQLRLKLAVSSRGSVQLMLPSKNLSLPISSSAVWSSLPAASDFGAPVVDFYAGAGSVSLDLTGPLNKWRSGAWENWGLILQSRLSDYVATFASSNSVSAEDRPVLVLDWEEDASPAVAPIVMTSSPAQQAFAAGAVATLSVETVSDTPVSYVWLKNGAVVAHANNAQLAVTVTEAADYEAEITNAIDSTRVEFHVGVLDTTPPFVAADARVWVTDGNGLAKITGKAADDCAVTTVTVQSLTATVQKIEGTDTWSADLVVPPGIHYADAIAHDAANNEASVRVRLINPTMDNDVPTVSGVASRGTDGRVRLQWNASDSLGIQSIIVSADGAVLCSETDAAGPGFGEMDIPLTVNELQLTVRDYSGKTSSVWVTIANTPPSISRIADLDVNENGVTESLAFTIDDTETKAAQLIVTAASSNPMLVPVTNIVLGGSGANRTVTVNPAAGQAGTATITVTVSDGTLTASTAFTLTVTTLAVAPVITSGASATFTAGQPGSFGVTATGTPAPTFSAIGLPPWANFNATTAVLSGTPPDTNGTPFTVTLTASNGTSPDATQIFTLTVQSPATAPTITTQPANQTVSVGGSTSFAAAASGNPAPTYQWQASTDGGSTWTNLTDTVPYSGTTTSTLTITGATVALNGYQYQCVATNTAGSANSNAATLTVTYTPSDTTGPTVAISAPTAGQSLTASVLTVSGTASDNVGVILVQVQLNSGGWQAATGTTSWSLPVTLASGSNTIQARSQDAAGNYSTVASVSVTYTPSATPVISSVWPISMMASGSDQTLTINGSNFQSGATLTFVPPEGGTIASTASKLTFVSSTRISYEFNNGSDAGTWSVKVNNPGGLSSNSVSFVVTTGATVVITTPLTVNTLVGQALSSGSSDGIGSAARFYYPSGIAADSAGNLYLADTDNHTIRKIVASTGAVTTLAGLAGSSGSADGTGSAARFNNPSGVAVDSAGNVYVADTMNNTVRRVTASGAVSTLAGQAGVAGSVNGTGTAAEFQGPQGLAIDSGSNLFVADTNNHTIRKVVPSTGVVTTVAGLAGNSGSVDGLGSLGRFNYPSGIAVDGAGILYVADTDNYTIRTISTTGLVSTLAGLAGNSGGADGTGGAARFDSPSDLAVDASGNVYVADTDNHTIRKVVPSTGAVSTLAGLAGTSGSADGLGSSVRFFGPTGIVVDSSSNLYIADTNNDTIRLGLLPVAPAIQTQPQSQTVTAGSNVQFAVTATGRPAVTYQWYFGSAAISGATSSSYSLSSAQSGNAGNYTVVVSNVMGSVTSNAATLTVNAVTQPPSGGSSGGGGGGGGAPSTWFCGALLLLVVVRKIHERVRGKGIPDC